MENKSSYSAVKNHYENLEAKWGFYTKVIEEYAEKNGLLARDLFDLSPFEFYLLDELYKEKK